MQPCLLQEVHPPVASQVLLGSQEAGKAGVGTRAISVTQDREEEGLQSTKSSWP